SALRTLVLTSSPERKNRRSYAVRRSWSRWCASTGQLIRRSLASSSVTSLPALHSNKSLVSSADAGVLIDASPAFMCREYSTHRAPSTPDLWRLKNVSWRVNASTLGSRFTSEDSLWGNHVSGERSRLRQRQVSVLRTRPLSLRLDALPEESSENKEPR